MICDVMLWADMSKLAEGSTSVWQHSRCCLWSFANAFQLALQKISLVEPSFFVMDKWFTMNAMEILSLLWEDK